ncbi:MAG TPA: diaminopimelate epimerase [Vicinamibacterales bacterium]|nr:diaminopimelate epimerase [Vicinamibacterales bacterium]
MGLGLFAESSIELIKAHAYGNDFLLVQAAEIRDNPAEFARRVCDRHQGIGADGLILLSPSAHAGGMDLLNADGSPSEISGNGLRCVAALLAIRQGLVAGASLVIDTDAGPKTLKLLDREGKRLTFAAEMGPPTDLRQVDLNVGDGAVRAVVLRVGNPQCVVLGPATQERLHKLGRELATHRYFSEGTNVELAEVVTPEEVRILIWERGVGPTESSGTGTCAAAVAAAAFGGAGRSVDVVAPGGRQHVDWHDAGLRLTGWAEVTATVAWWN